MLSTRWAHVGGTRYKEPPQRRFWRKAAPVFAPLGNAALTMELQTRSFPCSVNVTFPLLPLPPPSSGRGNTFSHQKHSQQQHRGEPGWALAPTGGVLPAHRLHSQGHGAKEGVGTAGKAQGDSCEQGTVKVELCPGGTAAGIVRGTGMRGGGGDCHLKGLPLRHPAPGSCNRVWLVTGFPKNQTSVLITD